METYDRNKAKKISRETISEDVANYKKSTIEESFLEDVRKKREPLEIINWEVFEEILGNINRPNKNLALIIYRN